jgi:hypothetical protein
MQAGILLDQVGAIVQQVVLGGGKAALQAAGLPLDARRIAVRIACGCPCAYPTRHQRRGNRGPVHGIHAMDIIQYNIIHYNPQEDPSCGIDGDTRYWNDVMIDQEAMEHRRPEQIAQTKH